MRDNKSVYLEFPRMRLSRAVLNLPLDVLVSVKIDGKYTYMWETNFEINWPVDGGDGAGREVTQQQPRAE